MQDILIVVDMQNDFVTGTLGSPEAVVVLPKVVEKVRGFDGRALFTRDTHEENYLDTQEGKNLPVVHCVRNTDGWQICPELEAVRKEQPVDKCTFGSVELGTVLRAADRENHIRKITLVGVCTDICVISNALLLKAFLPETEIAVDAACCAGVTPESHRTALNAMKACQITIENESGSEHK